MSTSRIGVWARMRNWRNHLCKFLWNEKENVHERQHKRDQRRFPGMRAIEGIRLCAQVRNNVKSLSKAEINFLIHFSGVRQRKTWFAAPMDAHIWTDACWQCRLVGSERRQCHWLTWGRVQRAQWFENNVQWIATARRKMVQSAHPMETSTTPHAKWNWSRVGREW